MKCSTVYQYVEEKIGSVFGKYGEFVAAHAWKVLIISVLVNIGLGIGMIKLDIDNDARNYLPSGSQEEIDMEKIEKFFPYFDYKNFDALRVTSEGPWLRFIVKSKDGNLLTRPVLEELQSFYGLLQNISVVVDFERYLRRIGKLDNRTDDYRANVTLSRICATRNGECVVDGELFIEEDFMAAVDKDNVSYPVFNSARKGKINYASFLGGKVELDTSGNYIKSAEFLRLQIMIPFYGNFHWLDVFKEEMSEYSSQYIEIAYGYFSSVNEELEKNLTGDITLFGGTMALMIVYAFAATFSARATDQVGQRIWLGFAGILAAGMAITSAIGLCSLAGVGFVTIVGVVPFLIIGIGIDDMFLLLSGLSAAQSKSTVARKMAQTMCVSGVGVTITSLTDLIAFMAGVGSEFVAVKNFCIYTAVAVVFCYLNNITFFAACVAINERRVNGNRHFMTCQRIKTKEELRSNQEPDCIVDFCGGRAPKNREEAESLIDRLPRWLIPKIVLKLPCKVLILVLYIPYIIFAIYGCIHMKQGMPFSQLVSDDSYFYKYSEWNEQYFPRQAIVMFVIPSTQDYSLQETQSKIDDLISRAHASSFFEENFEVNWLKSFRGSQYYSVASEMHFYLGLKDFFNDPQYMMFYNDVAVDYNNSAIVASRVFVRSKSFKHSEEGELMIEARKIAETASIDCFAYSPVFTIAELYVRILRLTAQSVGIALASVFVITCLFMPHPVLILFVTVAVASIMVGVVGYMLYLNVSLSAISMVMLIMSIGFSVDFTAHICHGYMMSHGDTRHDRVEQAIIKTGAPIFHGALSSILGVLVLVGAKSYIFRSFAAVMAFVLLFGIMHALFLLPVILSWFGPKKDSVRPEKNNQTTGKSDIESGKNNTETGNINKESGKSYEETGKEIKESERDNECGKNNAETREGEGENKESGKSYEETGKEIKESERDNECGKNNAETREGEGENKESGKNYTETKDGEGDNKESGKVNTESREGERDNKKSGKDKTETKVDEQGDNEESGKNNTDTREGERANEETRKGDAENLRNSTESDSEVSEKTALIPERTISNGIEMKYVADNGDSENVKLLKVTMRDSSGTLMKGEDV